MSAVLKDLYNKQLIRSLSDALADVYPEFEPEKLTSLVFDWDWKRKELKQRMRHITCSLHVCLPESYIGYHSRKKIMVERY